MAVIHQKRNIGVLSEALYLPAAALYILKAFSDTTMFYLAWPAGYETILRTLVLASILLKPACTRPSAGKGGLACIAAVILFKFSWLSTGYIFLVDIALLAAGAWGIPYRKILKTGFWIGLYALLTTMLGSFTGCITNLVYSGSGQFRHSFGIVYPTDFSAHVAFLALTGWVLYGGSSAMYAACAAGLAAFTGYYCRAKCSTAVLCLLAAAVLYHSITEKYGKKYKMLGTASKWVDRILPYVMPICAILMITLTLFYDPENRLMSNINLLLTNRLKLGRAAIDTYGIKLFGTAFDQVGFGGETAWTWTYTYNFIDSSYVLVLVRYGLTVLLALCAQNISIAKKALGNGDRRVALAAALVAVHSLIEHHLPEAAYNLFLLLPFASFQFEKTRHGVRQIGNCTSAWLTGLRKEAAAGKRPARLSMKNFVPCLAALAAGLAAVMAFPRAVGYLKTVVGVLHLDAQENRIWFIGIAAALLAVAHLLLWVTAKIIVLLLTGKPVRKAVYAGLCILPLAILGIALLGEPVISQAQEMCSASIEEDRPIIEALLAEKGSAGRLYVDYMPEAYRREFSGLSGMVLSAQGLAYRQDTTLITEDTAEMEALMDAGYEYGEISPGHAVYTNSAVAKGILEQAGVTLTSYYSRQRTVDLTDMAAFNGLEMTEGQNLLLAGSGKSLVHGLGITIYKGILRVEYQLHLTGAAFYEGTAATAKISSDWGQHSWGQKEISLSDFDENGHCTVVLDVNLWFSCPNMEFQLLVQDGVELEIQEIRYGKVG